jgi:hypothetical protein
MWRQQWRSAAALGWLSPAVFPASSGASEACTRGGAARGFLWWQQRGVARAVAALGGGWRRRRDERLRRAIWRRSGGIGGAVQGKRERGRDAVTPRNRYHEVSSDPDEIRTISIHRSPPTQCARLITHVMSDELTRVVTLQQDYNRDHKKHILQQQFQRVKIQIYNTKIQIIQKIKYVRVRTKYKLD